jgi:hypothetical protein
MDGLRDLFEYKKGINCYGTNRARNGGSRSAFGGHHVARGFLPRASPPRSRASSRTLRWKTEMQIMMSYSRLDSALTALLQGYHAMPVESAADSELNRVKAPPQALPSSQDGRPATGAEEGGGSCPPASGRPTASSGAGTAARHSRMQNRGRTRVRRW